MIDLTEGYRDTELLRNNPNFKVISFESIREAVLHYEKVSPYFVEITGVKFRVPEIAGQELFGRDLRYPLKKRAFILQDRDNKEWCWANDYSSSYSFLFGSRIKREFSDQDVLSTIFGKLIFHATMSDPVRLIDIYWYQGQIRWPKAKEDKKSARLLEKLALKLDPVFT